MEDRDTIIVSSCECGCKCGEVELHSEHQPEVLLFDEYGELYENVIIQIRDIATDSNTVVKGNSDKLDILLQNSAQYFEEATKKEVEQMFDGLIRDIEKDSDGAEVGIWLWLPSMDIDEDGYVELNIEVNDGYVEFLDE
jgi:hypothetical protein